MNEAMLKPTTARLIIVRELENGPKKFGQLRTAYYGEARAKANKATTSFYNKIDAGVEEGLVIKTALGYELGEKGRELLAYAKEKNIDLTVLKSEAQVRHEA